MPTLVFPAVNQLALEYLDGARRRGETVIAASSAYDARAAEAFGGLAMLPYVYDDAFAQAFLGLLEARDISKIFAPVASVYAFLGSFIERERLDVELVGESPIRRQVDAYRALRSQSEAAHAFVRDCAAGPGALSRLEVAAVLRHAATIYGESDADKLAATMAIFPSAPRGDVVEIGSLMGRSAFVLHYLARKYAIGHVLSVDPLSPATSFQREMPEAIQVAMDEQWDYDVLREAFAVNLLAVANHDFNYLRMESERGYEVYCAQRTIASQEFGEVGYAGSIAVVHIDGNHDFAHVDLDCGLWLRKLAEGAWLILDDYLWAHGDGPRRVGDALLEARKDDIARAFVCGKALFVKFR